MSGRFRLRKVSNQLHRNKPDEPLTIPGELGLRLGGERLVEVPHRPGFVYVRLRNDLSEVVQAYNDRVSPIYGLPVLVVRDKIDKGRYYIAGRDVGRYNNWGSSAYLPRHGAMHSFNPESPGADPVWVWSRQFTPMLGVPSGSSTSMNVLVYPGTLYYDNRWIYVGMTGTANLSAYKPTGSNARMILIYVDQSGNPQVQAGSYFDASLTGTQQVYPYLPAMPTQGLIPISGVRLVSGTTSVTWDNLYDLRQFLHWGVFTGTAGGASAGGHTIQYNGTPLTTRTYLNFVGTNFLVFDDPVNGATVVSGSAGGGSSAQIGTPSNQIAIGSPTSLSSPGVTGTAMFTVRTTPSPKINLLVNGTGNDGFTYSADNSINVIRQARTDDAQIAIWNYNSGTTVNHEYDSPPRVRFYAAKGAEGSPISIVSGSVLGQFDFMGYGTDDWYMAGMIRGVAIQPGTSNSQNAVLQISFGNTGTLSFDQTSLTARQEFYRDRFLAYTPIAVTTGTNQGYYYGDIFSNGSWRSVVEHEKISFQKRINNAWVTQGYSNPGPTGSNQIIYADHLGRLTNNKRLLVNPYKWDSTYPSVVIGAPTGVSIGTENYLLNLVSDEFNQPNTLGLWGYGPGWWPVLDFIGSNGSLTGTSTQLLLGDTVGQINFKGQADGIAVTVGRITVRALSDFYTSSGTVTEMVMEVVPPNNNANTIDAMTIRGQDVQFYEDIILPSGSIYLGDRTTDGSWRIRRNGNDLIFQRLVTGTWTTKSTITG